MTKPTLIKVYDDTCHICKELSGGDKDLALSKDFSFEEVEMSDLAIWPEQDPFRSYVVHYHVADDGMIDLPVYVVVNKGAIQASSVVKTLEEITNLIESWEVWSKSQ